MQALKLPSEAPAVLPPGDDVFALVVAELAEARDRCEGDGVARVVAVFPGWRGGAAVGGVGLVFLGGRLEGLGGLVGGAVVEEEELEGVLVPG